MLNKRRFLMLLLIACLAVGGTLFQTYQFEQRVDRDRAAEDAVVQQLDATADALADVRYAQAGYVAVGQGADFWMARFNEDLARVEGMLRERQRTTVSSGALTHYDAAIEQLGALRKSDGRARNYVDNGQLILASDVIFVESGEIIGQIAGNVSAARDTESFESRRALADVTRYRQAVGASGLAFTLLVGIILYARIKVTPIEELPHVVETAEDAAQQTTPTSVAAPTEVTGVTGVKEAADVCVDLARLLDGRDLPVLLSRAAAAIGAKGLVLWVIDESGQHLRASMAHGYSDRMLSRLGQLPVSGDNATALACRTLQSQVVPGALAVPLIGATGCVGVLAAEIVGTGTSRHQLPIARLIAAQLSVVIRPDAATSSSSSESVGSAAVQ